MKVNRIWDKAKYNAFPDLIRYQDKWLCALREGVAHAGDHGTLRIIGSENGAQWDSITEIRVSHRDLRDCKLSITPNGQLMLNTYMAYDEKLNLIGQSLSYFSDNGHNWQGPCNIGDPGLWLWRTDWHKGVGYSIGYGHVPERIVRLYRTLDGINYETILDRLYDKNGPSEYALVFREDDTCLCLLRRDNLISFGGDNALLGLARPPYTEWRWLDLGCRIGGPEMIALPDGRLIAAVRKYEFTAEGHYVSEWLELCWVDEIKGQLQTITKLPSGLDCSYSGMEWYEDELWVTYYSAHEEKPCIYLARGTIE